MAGDPVSGDRILALDVGTQSVRALLFDDAGELHARARVPIEPYVSPRPGWAEQDPAVYWNALGEACRRLWDEPGADPGAVAGLALTTQRATTVVTDAEGRPLRDAIVWTDKRRAPAVPNLGRLWRTLFAVAGAGGVLREFQARCHANWLAAETPELWGRVDRCLMLSGWLNFRLCGAFVDAAAAQVGYIPFDFKRHDWPRAGDWKWRATVIRREQLPALAAPGEHLGELTAEAAAHLGLPAGLAVIAAGADKACEVLGAGGFEPETGVLSFGTTATVNTCRKRYLEVNRFAPAYPAAIPGHYNDEVQINHGFWLVSWFKEQFAERERRIAGERGIEPEALFDELIADIPPGCLGLTLQPYWSAGVRDPGPEAKGAIVGFGDVHTRAHIYRAILEGLAYALRGGKERIEKRSRVPFRRLRVAGGGSQSDAAMQITADVFGMTAERPHVYEASGLGAAINAAVGLGRYPDHAAAAAAMTRPGRSFTPDPEARAVYERLYRRVYRRMYDRLRPLYTEIREITGYPPY